MARQWRFVWHVLIEREASDDERPWPPILRWAVIGLAVLGVLGVIAWRAFVG